MYSLIILYIHTPTLYQVLQTTMPEKFVILLYNKISFLKFQSFPKSYWVPLALFPYYGHFAKLIPSPSSAGLS